MHAGSTFRWTDVTVMMRDVETQREKKKVK